MRAVSDRLSARSGWFGPVDSGSRTGEIISSTRTQASPQSAIPTKPRSSSGPGHRPLTAETGVRLPYGVLGVIAATRLGSHRLAKQPGFSGLLLFLAAPVREDAAWVLHLILRPPQWPRQSVAQSPGDSAFGRSVRYCQAKRRRHAGGIVRTARFAAWPSYFGIVLAKALNQPA